MSPVPGMEAMAALGWRHPPGERVPNLPQKSIPLALKSSSWLNIQHSAGLGWHPAQGDMTRQHQGLFDDQSSDERKAKIFHLASMDRQFLAREEVRRASTSFHDEDGHERNPKRYCLSL